MQPHLLGEVFFMRLSYNGSTVASKPTGRGSIPRGCANFCGCSIKDIIPGCQFGDGGSNPLIRAKKNDIMIFCG
jgi:hypothetical protein